MNIQIKMGRKDDISIAHQLMLVAFEEYRFLDVPSSAINESEESLNNLFESENEKFIICYYNDLPQGTTRFTIKEDSLYFSRVSVSPIARGKGLAKSMLLWLEQYAKNLEKAKIECRVRVALQKNILLYEALGYKIARKENVINPNGFHVNTVLMEKFI